VDVSRTRRRNRINAVHFVPTESRDRAESVDCFLSLAEFVTVGLEGLWAFKGLSCWVLLQVVSFAEVRERRRVAAQRRGEEKSPISQSVGARAGAAAQAGLDIADTAGECSEQQARRSADFRCAFRSLQWP